MASNNGVFKSKGYSGSLITLRAITALCPSLTLRFLYYDVKEQQKKYGLKWNFKSHLNELKYHLLQNCTSKDRDVEY